MPNDFMTQIQSDEIAARDGVDWVNDFESTDNSDDDIFND